jgi:thymidylate synthase
MNARSFLVADSRLRNRMLNEGTRIHPARWQGIDISQRLDAEMVELLNVDLDVDLRGIESLEHWRAEIRPNLPWADDHFAERVSGKPLNPPPSWAWWPWANSAEKFRTGEKFNHTYPERYWPKQAGLDEFTLKYSGRRANHGIRGYYGDLNDVVELMLKDPLTRQAYLPIFFPEDTGVGDGGRKPCTLGYQFIVRDNKLHTYYPMRSCDLLRHFRDDCYLTVRLAIWVLEELARRTSGEGQREEFRCT